MVMQKFLLLLLFFFWGGGGVVEVYYGIVQVVNNIKRESVALQSNEG